METEAIMKRVFVASLLSLAIAGCAQSRSVLSEGDSAKGSRGVGPVAVTPVPSLYDTVNSGMGGSSVARTAMSKPHDPHWSGRAPSPSAGAGPAGAMTANRPQPASARPARDQTAPPPAELSLQPAQTGRAAAADSPAQIATAAPASDSPTGKIAGTA